MSYYTCKNCGRNGNISSCCPGCGYENDYYCRKVPCKVILGCGCTCNLMYFEAQPDSCSHGGNTKVCAKCTQANKEYHSYERTRERIATQREMQERKKELDREINREIQAVKRQAEQEEEARMKRNPLKCGTKSCANICGISSSKAYREVKVRGIRVPIPIPRFNHLCDPCTETLRSMRTCRICHWKFEEKVQQSRRCFRCRNWPFPTFWKSIGVI
jgi:hypothetical protein